ncbi:hypothetical protein ACPEEZ_00545 [Frigoribacterium sp. 2-23]|uniref:hypothetical protein n=1 Tax=Frigoribacterium sp. 2-23 TaxID=3415006 RepID=UPI003C6FD738
MSILLDMAERVAAPVLNALVTGLASDTVGAVEAVEFAINYVDTRRTNTTSEDRAAKAIGLADAALGAEGHSVVDPYVRELTTRVALGRMTGDDAMPFVMALVDAGPVVSDPSVAADPGYRAEETRFPVVDVQAEVDAGRITPDEGNARVVRGYRVFRALTNEAETNDLTDPVLNELIASVLRGERSDIEATEIGVRRIRRMRDDPPGM